MSKLLSHSRHPSVSINAFAHSSPCMSSEKIFPGASLPLTVSAKNVPS